MSGVDELANMPTRCPVMRAEGVFRLILNVNLFPGMFCDVTEKYLKIVAMEDGAMRTYLMKVSGVSRALDATD